MHRHSFSALEGHTASDGQVGLLREHRLVTPRTPEGIQQLNLTRQLRIVIQLAEYYFDGGVNVGAGGVGAFELGRRSRSDTQRQDLGVPSF